MKDDISSEAADHILAGNKLAAIKCIRQELNCSLAEAKAIADEFDGDLGSSRPAQATPKASTYESRNNNDERLRNEKPSFLGYLWLAICKVDVSDIKSAHRYCKEHNVDLTYGELKMQVFAGGNATRTAKCLHYANTLGKKADPMQIIAGDLAIQDEEKLKQWIDEGMPRLDEFLTEQELSGDVS